tara:strand:+ start:183 stop:611 length:429 start_codon:yes stop_codon:yes gene_type:complete
MQAILAQFPGHLRTICEFSLNRPPMRAKVDRQSFDELKPGVEAAIALLDWYEQLSAEFIALVDRLAKAAPPLPAEELGLICTAVDCLVLMENQACHERPRAAAHPRQRCTRSPCPRPVAPGRARRPGRAARAATLAWPPRWR